MTRNIALCLGILAACHSSADGADHPCAAGERFYGTVAAGSQTDLFQFHSSPGRERPEKFSLAGLYLPEVLVLSGSGAGAGPVEIYVSNPQPDRYDRFAGHVFQNDKWLQGTLLKKGKALVFGLDQSAACLQAMRAAEKQARQQKRGVWAEDGVLYESDQTETVSRQAGKYIVVTGKVLSIGDRHKRLYLNFGQDWSKDFTVSIVKKGAGAFNGDLEALRGLENQKVEVRGIVEENKGPLMRIVDEAQIERVD